MFQSNNHLQIPSAPKVTSHSPSRSAAPHAFFPNQPFIQRPQPEYQYSQNSMPVLPLTQNSYQENTPRHGNSLPLLTPKHSLAQQNPSYHKPIIQHPNNMLQRYPPQIPSNKMYNNHPGQMDVHQQNYQLNRIIQHQNRMLEKMHRRLMEANNGIQHPSEMTPQHNYLNKIQYNSLPSNIFKSQPELGLYTPQHNSKSVESFAFKQHPQRKVFNFSDHETQGYIQSQPQLSLKYESAPQDIITERIEGSSRTNQAAASSRNDLRSRLKIQIPSRKKKSSLISKSDKTPSIKLPSSIDVKNLEFADFNNSGNEAFKCHKDTLTVNNKKLSAIKKVSANDTDDVLNLDLSVKKPRALSKKYKPTLIIKRSSQKKDSNGYQPRIPFDRDRLKFLTSKKHLDAFISNNSSDQE